MIILMNVALIPPLFLMAYIYRMDKIEREPIGLLVKLFIFGVLSTVAASILEEFGMGLMEGLFGSTTTILTLLIENFIVVALVEEGVKYFALRWGSWKNKAFDYVFDGVVYGVVTSLGFAAAENVLYLLSYGVGIGPIRAVTAIPLHCITGIFMGNYYGIAKYYSARNAVTASKRYLRYSIVVPMLIHGIYDFAASVDSYFMTLFFWLFVIVLDVIAFRNVKKYAREDSRIEEYKN